MLKAMTVVNFKGEECRMVLSQPQDSGFVITNIDGIGGGNANINTSEMATGDGSWFNSSRMIERDISISITYWRFPSVEYNRHKLYQYFPVKRAVTLIFETDERMVSIDGYTESVDSDIFSETEGVQISIVCPNPYFYEPDTSSTVFLGANPQFEFPFSNESLTENLIIFGDIRLHSRTDLDYHGDADSGIVITIHALGDAKNITLYNPGTNETMVIDTDRVQSITGGKFTAGDDIIVSTMIGEKSLLLLRAGVYYNIVGAIPKDADWFQLTPGSNVFAFSAEEGEDQLMVTFSFRNNYGGV